MEPIWAAAITVGLLFLFLGLGVWVFSGLMLVSMTSLIIVNEMSLNQLGSIVKGTMWDSASTWELAAIPIFVWMGELIIRTDISDRMFRGLEPWADLLPGRLLHVNVIGCTIFAAVSGSSAATTATIGKITTRALLERNYDDRIAVGSLAGAGSLGLMIPPSIVMIVYGVLADQSIAQLFAAGLIPGLLIAFFYFAFIALWALVNPDVVPEKTQTFSARDRLHGLLELAPVIALASLVLGGIYTGVATPSEAAALGVFGTLSLTLATGQLSWSVFHKSLDGAIKTTCMLVTIVVAAAFMSSAMAYMHIPASIAAGITTLGLGPFGLIAILAVFYLLLGMFLEGISILVLSLPITLPLIVAQGWDPVWFGVFLVIMIELAQITPPVGLNLFVIQGLTGQPIGKIALSALPFFLLLLLCGLILTLFPEIALWLPRVLYQ